MYPRRGQRAARSRQASRPSRFPPGTPPPFPVGGDPNPWAGGNRNDFQPCSSQAVQSRTAGDYFTPSPPRRPAKSQRSPSVPDPARGEKGKSLPPATASQLKSHWPPEPWAGTPAQTSLLRGDPPTMNSLAAQGSGNGPLKMVRGRESGRNFLCSPRPGAMERTFGVRNGRHSAHLSMKTLLPCQPRPLQFAFPANLQSAATVIDQSG